MPPLNVLRRRSCPGWVRQRFKQYPIRATVARCTLGVAFHDTFSVLSSPIMLLPLSLPDPSKVYGAAADREDCSKNFDVAVHQEHKPLKNRVFLFQEKENL